MKPRTKIILISCIQGLLLIAVLANLLATLGLRDREPDRPSLACAAMPMDFIHRYPECADHLLQAMNITHVRVFRYNGTLPGDEIYQDPIYQMWREAHANLTRHLNITRKR